MKAVQPGVRIARPILDLVRCCHDFGSIQVDRSVTKPVTVPPSHTRPLGFHSVYTANHELSDATNVTAKATLRSQETCILLIRCAREAGF